MIPTISVTGVCDVDAVRRSIKMFLETQLELTGFMDSSDVPRAKWTVQGFGMLRCYLGNDATRLNVWHSAHKVPNVSTIHTHPWHFNSLVVNGQLCNERFIPHAYEFGKVNTSLVMSAFFGSSMKPGIGGGLHQEPPRLYKLQSRGVEKYETGAVYSQQAHEVHESSPADGTVTLNHRFKLENDEAFVFWPEAQGVSGWVSAEPRLATRQEIQFVLTEALRSWR